MLAILGFLAPFVPDLFGIGKQWIDHRQETQMLRLQAELAEKNHAYRLEQLEVEFALADRRSARRSRQSYGVKLLEAAANQDHVWRWSFNLAFMSFAALDWLISAVRPTVSYWVFGLYGLHKAGQFQLIFGTKDTANSLTARALEVFTTNGFYTAFDQDILFVILGFWFGDRVRRRANNSV